MKDEELKYFVLAFIVGMFIHYNIKQICKVGLLEGSDNKCGFGNKYFGWVPGVDSCPEDKTTTAPPAYAETCNWYNEIFFWVPGVDACKPS